MREIDWVWSKEDLRPCEKMVLLACTWLHCTVGHATIPRIAQLAEMSTRTVQRQLRTLEERGYVYWAPVIDRTPLAGLGGLGDGSRCQWCGQDFPLLVQHHLVSSSEGGTDERGNLVWLCPNCHALAHHDVLMVNPLE